MSRAPTVSSREIEVQPAADDPLRGIQIVGKAGPLHADELVLGARLAVPLSAGYLRKLPSSLVSDCMNYGLKFDRDVEDIGLLLTKEGEPLP